MPIGPSRHSTFFPKPDATEAKDRLFEKFWQVLHKEGASEAEKLILEEKTEKVLFQAGDLLFPILYSYYRDAISSKKN